TLSGPHPRRCAAPPLPRAGEGVGGEGSGQNCLPGCRPPTTDHRPPVGRWCQGSSPSALPGCSYRSYNQSVLIARAAMIASTTSDINPCVIISSLARRESTRVSVGLKAVLVLNARNR